MCKKLTDSWTRLNLKVNNNPTVDLGVKICIRNYPTVELGVKYS